MMKRMINQVMNLLEKYYLIPIIITLFVAGFIFYMSSKTFEKGTPVDFPYKAIIYHFGIFLIFAFFLCISLVKGKKQNKNWIYIALLISLSYAITDELHQFFVPNRYCSVIDFMIDSAGIFLGTIFYEKSMRLKQHQKVF